jgi:putative IMPACT (imprinted ancient) family translation regulator
MPILDFIKKQELNNILIVVTRYFGGTLLGTGGLVRAYGRAAKEAAEAAVIIEKVLHQKFSITVPYHLGGKLEYEIRSKGYILTEAKYTDNIDFIVLAQDEQAKNLTDHITNITANTAKITSLGTAHTAAIDGKTMIL